MTQSLKTLLEHAEQLRDEGQLALQQAEAAERDLQAQAEQLSAYAVEYEGRHPAREGRLAPIEVLRCHLGFMQRLRQAQAQQAQQLQAAQARSAQRRTALLALELRVAAVRKLIERRQQEHQRGSQRLEQRRHDDASQQAAWTSRIDMPMSPF